MSDNLGVGRIAAGMSIDALGAQANDMAGGIDAALTNPGTFTIDGSNTLTLTAAEFIGNVGFQINPAGSPPIGASTLNVPSANAAAETLKRGLFVVINKLAQTLAVQVSGQALTAPVLAADTYGLCFMDGSDVRLLATGAVGGGGATTFLGLTDTPGSYSGQAGKRLAVKSDASGLEFTDAGGTGSADWKESCRVASTANLALSGEQTIDGVAVVTGERVLAKDQSTAAENGIYDVAAGAWVRAADADASDEVTSGLTVSIEEGTANGGKEFRLTTPDPITLDSTSLTFEETAAAIVSDNAFLVYTRKTAADYTLALTDPNRWLGFTNSGAKTLTVPPHSSVKIPVNSEIVAQWRGSSGNELTIVAGSGVTVDAPNGLVLPSQFSYALLKKTHNNRWTVQIVPSSGGGGGTKATDAQVRSAAAGDVYIAPELLETASAFVTLTDAATVAVDWDTFVNAEVTFAGDRTIGNPTNGQPGTWRTVLFRQDATGSRVPTFGSQYHAPGGAFPTFSTTANAVDVIQIHCITSSLFYVYSALDMKAPA